MYHNLISVIAVWLTISLYAGASEKVFTKEEVLAAVNVINVDISVKDTLSFCKRRVIESYNASEFSQYFWDSSNFKVISVANNIQKTITNEELSEIQIKRQKDKSVFLQKMNNSSLPYLNNYCTKVIGSVAKNNLSIRSMLPSDYSILQTHVPNTDQTIIKDQEIDAEVGCVKGQFNNGQRNLKKAKSLCSCMVQTVKEASSNNQGTNFFSEIANGTPSKAALQAIKKAQNNC